MELRDLRIWLIGASSGIGEALAIGLGAEGAMLALSARSAAQLERVADLVRSRGGTASVVPLDVTGDNAVPAAAREIEAALGGIDVLIYCAGQWTVTDVTDFDVAAIEAQIAVNYVGEVRAIGAVLPHMIERGSGAIVGVASVAGYNGLPQAAGYGSTKAAVNVLLQSLRLELPAYGISVTTVNPGFVETPLTERNRFPMPFMMTPEQAADRIVRGLLAGHEEIHFPRRLSIPLKLLGALPRPIYERVVRAFTGSGRPRRGTTPR